MQSVFLFESASFNLKWYLAYLPVLFKTVATPLTHQALSGVKLPKDIFKLKYKMLKKKLVYLSNMRSGLPVGIFECQNPGIWHFQIAVGIQNYVLAF